MNRGRTEVKVLLSKYHGPAVTLAIRPSGLPWKGPTHYEVFLLDGGHDFSRIRSGSCVPGDRLVQELTAPSVWLLKLRQATPDG